jgi:ABC-type nitrate/sulfonate/bicarbonate transport system substrate-binding protein
MPTEPGARKRRAGIASCVLHSLRRLKASTGRSQRFMLPASSQDISMPQAFMSHVAIGLRACTAGLGLIMALTCCNAPAFAAKIRMVFPGPVTTFSLPYLVAQKKGWLGGLEVEDIHVTGDPNAMRVLLSGNADIALIGTLNVLASIHAGAGIRAIHSWQPIGDYNLVAGEGQGRQARRPRRQDHRDHGAGRHARSAAATADAALRDR